MQAAGGIATCEGSNTQHSIDLSTEFRVLRVADDDTVGASAILFQARVSALSLGASFCIRLQRMRTPRSGTFLCLHRGISSCSHIQYFFQSDITHRHICLACRIQTMMLATLCTDAHALLTNDTWHQRHAGQRIGGLALRMHLRGLEPNDRSGEMVAVSIDRACVVIGSTFQSTSSLLRNFGALAFQFNVNADRCRHLRRMGSKRRNQ